MKLIHFKYLAGTLVMVACWAVGIYSISGRNKAATLPPIIEAESYCTALEVDFELALPTQKDIIGVDLMLFEPIPPKEEAKKKK